MALTYIGYEVDLSDVEATLAQMDAELELTENELFRIGARAAFMIKQRTANGVGFDGKRFHPYSEDYAEFRKEHGRNTSPVDLLFEGHMLAATMGFTDGEYAIVKVLGEAEGRKAHWHNEGTKRMPQRRWLDIDEGGAEAETLAEMAAQFMASRIEQL